MRNKLFDIAVLPNENKNKGLIGDWAFANFECVLHTRPRFVLLEMENSLDGADIRKLSLLFLLCWSFTI